VGVFGCGPIGLLIVQLARVAGAVEVLATDALPHRVDAARDLGATRAMPAGRRGDLEATATEMGGEGLDVVFEVAGDDGAVADAMACARPGARVVLGGIPSGDRTSFQASVARRKGLTLVMCRRMKHTYPRAIQLVERGLVDVRSLVTHRFALEDCAGAFDSASRRIGLKTIVVPSATEGVAGG